MTIHYLPIRSKSTRPDGVEVRRSEYRDHRDPVRTEAEVIVSLRLARQRAEPRAERPCDQEDMPA
jgi:hypothetical protein